MLLLVTSLALLSGIGIGAGQLEREDIEINISGLDDNQQLTGIVTFNIAVGSQVAFIYGFTNLMPLRDGTSYLIGQWGTRQGRNIRARFDTKYLPDGVHAVTFFTRDRQYRLLSMRTFSVAVQNYRTETLVASHVEIERPQHLDSQKGNAVEVKVRDFKTEAVDKLVYRITPLGVPTVNDIISDEPKITLRGRPAGWYAVSVWAFDRSGQAIDRSTITVFFDPGR
jgi:hypothetical protein